MRLYRSTLLAISLFAALTAHAQISPNDAMRTCKDTASNRLPSIPRAFINVQRGSDAGDNYMINWRAQPERGPAKSGFCIISRRGNVKDFQFDAPPNNGGGYNNGGGIGGNHGGRISPEDAMRACKDTASSRLPDVPRAFISTYRASDPPGGGYVINFRSQPPNRRPASGFCNISWNGAVKNFQFDAPPPPPPGPQQNWGGQSPLEAMRSCKNVVSARFPQVPLAFIEVDQPRVNGGSLLSVFRVRAPNGFRADGTCDVFKNGKVNLSLR